MQLALAKNTASLRRKLADYIPFLISFRNGVMQQFPKLILCSTVAFYGTLFLIFTSEVGDSKGVSPLVGTDRTSVRIIHYTSFLPLGKKYSALKNIQEVYS